MSSQRPKYYCTKDDQQRSKETIVPQSEKYTEREVLAHTLHINPKILHKLAQIEDGMRFYGYSTLRIGIGIVIATGKDIKFVCNYIA